MTLVANRVMRQINGVLLWQVPPIKAVKWHCLELIEDQTEIIFIELELIGVSILRANDIPIRINLEHDCGVFIGVLGTVCHERSKSGGGASACGHQQYNNENNLANT